MVERIYQLHTVFPSRVFMYLGSGKQLPKTLSNLESDSVFED